MIPEFNSAAELRAHYAALALRKGRAVKPPVVVRPAPPPKPVRTHEFWRDYIMTLEQVGNQQRTLAEICEAVGAVSNLSQKAIRGHGRLRQVTVARSVIYYLARCLTSLSYPNIAERLNRINHTTVMSGARAVHLFPSKYEPVLTNAMSSLGVSPPLFINMDESAAENARKHTSRGANQYTEEA